MIIAIYVRCIIHFACLNPTFIIIIIIFIIVVKNCGSVV